MILCGVATWCEVALPAGQDDPGHRSRRFPVIAAVPRVARLPGTAADPAAGRRPAPRPSRAQTPLTMGRFRSGACGQPELASALPSATAAFRSAALPRRRHSRNPACRTGGSRSARRGRWPGNCRRGPRDGAKPPHVARPPPLRRRAAPGRCPSRPVPAQWRSSRAARCCCRRETGERHSRR